MKKKNNKNNNKNKNKNKNDKFLQKGGAAVLGLAIGSFVFGVGGPLIAVIGAGILSSVTAYKVLNRFKTTNDKEFLNKITKVTNYFDKTREKYIVDQRPIGENIMHYTLTFENNVILQWAKHNNDLMYFMYKDVTILFRRDNKVYCNSAINLEDAPSIENNKLVVPTLWEAKLKVMRQNAKKIREKINTKKKNAKTKISAFIKLKKGKNPVNKPAFDPLPFLGDIQQREHKVYKNLRY